MKRHILIISALLLCIALKAQEATYTCRYWFDQNHAQAVTTTFGANGWEAEFDVGQLSDGLHALHLHVLAADTVSVLNIENDSLYHERDTVIMKWSAPQSYLFLKVNDTPSEALVYHCWFDQDFEHQQSNVLGNGHLLLDVAELEDGMHTVNVMVEGNALTATQSYSFLKVAIEDPTAGMQYHCWFDQDYNTVQTGFLANGVFQLDVSALPNGLHTVNVQINNGTLTAPQTYLFYKIPLGGYGVARWEYWLNDDFDNRNITTISPSLDTLDIISLLPVGHPSIRSSCFHFHPNGDAPYINAKNQINFRFYDSELRVMDKSAYYVDEQVEQDIVATVFERNTTETFAAPRNNQIQWFKLDAEGGEYLSFQADKACTMQLFAPSGEEVYAVSGPESIVQEGFNVWEDGIYYLAVHDVTGSGETLSVTYNWLNRYAIVSYDVHLVGNGGCSTITFQGNGFNSLLDAYLVNYQNDTIHRLDIGHESNTTTTVTFNFYEENLGVYDAVFVFYDETIRVNSALGVQEPVDIVLTSTVSYPSRFLRNTPCTYTFTITNEGNMTAYNVPLYVYIGTNTLDGISHLTINGLKLKKIHEYIDNFADYTEQEQQGLKQLSELIGEDHYFGPYINANADGDSVAIRAGYFITDLAPYETRTVSFDITSSQTIGLWLSMPDEWSPVSAFSNERMCCFGVVDSAGQWNQSGDRSHFCCWHDGLEAGLSALSTTAGTVAMIGFFIPDLITTAGAGIAETVSLVSGAFGTLSGVVASVWCQDNPPQDFFDWNSQKGNWASLLGNVLNVASKRWPEIKIIGAVSAVGGPILDAYGMSNSLASREEAHKSSLCADNPPVGGQSTPVNSLDPNNIHGYLSESGSHYMRQEIQNVQYEIEFENDTTLATAAAHTIIVRDTLDATKFDLNSLAARSVTIGDKRLDLNGEQTFARTLDLRPELYVIAQVEQDYDPTTGIIQWTIQSLDPMTMEPTNDPNQGVLTVNYYGNGVGFIDYSIDIKETFADGTDISNRAGIIFDQEDVIMTPTWTNIVDAIKPTSHIENVTFEADTLNFSFVSSDNRSGVWYHTLYYRNDSTEMEWKVKKAQIFEDSYILHLEDLLTTEYLVLAVDSAGNHEEKEMVAEYVFTASGLHFVTEGNWSTDANWEDCTMPGTNDVVFIDAPCLLNQDAEVAALVITNGQTLTVQSGKTLTVNGILSNASEEGLIIEDGAQLVHVSENVGATVKKNILGYGMGKDKFYLISNPLASSINLESSDVYQVTSGNYDLYDWLANASDSLEWRNYKKNPFTLSPEGRGYLYANQSGVELNFPGILKPSRFNFSKSVTYGSGDAYRFIGWNLIGNPFVCDAYLINADNQLLPYYKMNAVGDGLQAVATDAIAPLEGVFYQASESGIVYFTRNAPAKSGGQLNLSVNQGGNMVDNAIIQFGKGNTLEKFSLSENGSKLFITMEGKDYAVVNSDSEGEMLVSFKAEKSGSYTLSFFVEEMSFSYLHLIDTQTGADIDLLQQPSYNFEALEQTQEWHFKLLYVQEGR